MTPDNAPAWRKPGHAITPAAEDIIAPERRRRSLAERLKALVPHQSPVPVQAREPLPPAPRLPTLFPTIDRGPHRLR